MRSFKGRDFLTLMDYTKDEILRIIDLADELKEKHYKGERHDYLQGKTIAMIFEKHSTRTRLSFQAGAAHLGMQAFYMDPSSTQISRGESLADTARVVDRYVDALVIRTFEQEIVEDFARYMKKPVINALTNESHPCQLLADIQHVREKKGRLHDLKIGYVGDVWNMAHSWGITSAIFGWEMVYALPAGYESRFWPRAKEFIEKTNRETGGSFRMTQDLREAITDADIVVGITFVSMTRGGDEEENRRKLKDFMPYQINSEVMSWAKKDAIYMHCLPAHRGEEVTDEVIEGPRSFVFDEAENRMHTEKALLALLLGGVE
ncbi:MAG: ornithine carbamoyltransferase [Candidatus Thorarchaeota archaeon]